MKIYISGPMTGLPEFNFPAFNAAAENLRLMGHEVSNPAEKGELEGYSHADYLAIDLIEVCKLRIPAGTEIGSVVLLPGWENSKGALMEVATAKSLDIPVITLEEFNKNEMEKFWAERDLLADFYSTRETLATWYENEPATRGQSSA